MQESSAGRHGKQMSEDGRRVLGWPYHYDPQPLTKRSFSRACIGDNHNRRVFAALSRQGPSHSASSLLAAAEDPEYQRDMASRYKEVMRRVPGPPGAHRDFLRGTSVASVMAKARQTEPLDITLAPPGHTGFVRGVGGVALQGDTLPGARSQAARAGATSPQAAFLEPPALGSQLSASAPFLFPSSELSACAPSTLSLGSGAVGSEVSSTFFTTYRARLIQ
eukprot:TRINITY_DN9630_c0_g1_i1.p1 TRINITY_DN9630_c0_g1~~TRINITY_DN9630_c0_g1_i1.p1  ORF type:complete len:221 (+),score=21.99 TRINITY_DN9630_c0_g1_i1:153-815(+)